MDETPEGRFSEACGGRLRLSVEGPGAAGAVAVARRFAAPFAVAGGAAGSDLVLAGPDVRRRHAYFQRVGGRLFCVDLRGRPWDLWAGRAEAWGWVDAADGVVVGGHRVRPGGTDPGGPGAAGGGEPLPVSRSFRAPEGPEAALRSAGDGPGPRPAWRVSRSLVLVGHSPLCKVRLAPEGVSAVHAALVRAGGGVWAVDLLAGGGLAVNGAPVRFAPLSDGDEVRVGPHRLRFDLGASARDLYGAAGPPALRARSAPPATAAAVAWPAAPAAGGLDPAVEAAVLRAQEQLADRFNQSLAVAVRVLEGVYQEQIASLRDEADRLRGAPAPPAFVRPGAGGAAPGGRRLGGPGPATAAAGPPPAADAHDRINRKLRDLDDAGAGWRRLVDAVLGSPPAGTTT